MRSMSAPPFSRDRSAIRPRCRCVSSAGVGASLVLGVAGDVERLNLGEDLRVRGHRWPGAPGFAQNSSNSNNGCPTCALVLRSCGLRDGEPGLSFLNRYDVFVTRGLVRYQRFNHLHFITSSCTRRRPCSAARRRAIGDARPDGTTRALEMVKLQGKIDGRARGRHDNAMTHSESGRGFTPRHTAVV